jgi:hypothetical protein
MSRFHALIAGVEKLVGRVTLMRDSRLGKLRGLLLRQAFSGELVAQDPTDEPAEVLLKEIQERREADSSQATLGRKKRVARGGRSTSAKEATK